LVGESVPPVFMEKDSEPRSDRLIPRRVIRREPQNDGFLPVHSTQI
jgi:hypothetical protein